MADTADIAAEREQFDTALAIRAARARPSDVPQPTGFCLNCGEPLPSDQTFCDGDCRDDWQHRERCRRRA